MARARLTTIPKERFLDRQEAGKLLGERLQVYRGQDVIVLGIPRGGLPVAAEVAEMLDAELDVVVARKLGAPGYTELAIGAITANGGIFLNEDMIRDLNVRPAYLKSVTQQESAEAAARESRFRRGRPSPPLTGRTVIVVDDGLATGATMRAALRSVAKQHPAKLVAAVPVGSDQGCEALLETCDEVLCLLHPDPFYAVGLYYEHFEPTPDRVVEALPQEAHDRRAAPSPQTAG